MAWVDYFICLFFYRNLHFWLYSQAKVWLFVWPWFLVILPNAAVMRLWLSKLLDELWMTKKWKGLPTCWFQKILSKDSVTCEWFQLYWKFCCMYIFYSTRHVRWWNLWIFDILFHTLCPSCNYLKQYHVVTWILQKSAGGKTWKCFKSIFVTFKIIINLLCFYSPKK